MVEKSASGTSHTGKKAFKTVTSFSVSANVTALTVGTGVVLGLPVAVAKEENILWELINGALKPSNPALIRLYFQTDETDTLAGTSIYLSSPCAGTIKRMETTVWKAVTTGGTLTLTNDTVAVAGLAVVVGDTSAVGVTDSDTPTLGDASTAVVAGGVIKVVGDAAFATAGALTGFVEIEPTSHLNGTFVGALQAASSYTSADVRGTYISPVTPDGATSITLLAALAQPDYLGVAQKAS